MQRSAIVPVETRPVSPESAEDGRGASGSVHRPRRRCAHDDDADVDEHAASHDGCDDDDAKSYTRTNNSGSTPTCADIDEYDTVSHHNDALHR